MSRTRGEGDGALVGATLLVEARSAIVREIDGEGDGPTAGSTPQAPWLSEPGATFVTLTQEGRLRGCIGSLVARRALGADVRANAVAAAFTDRRFPPLGAAELSGTRVSVSLLSVQEPLKVGTEAEAWERLRPGVDGVVLEFAGRRSTFLPQVWEELGDPAIFLGHLKRKAGLPADFWHEDVRLLRYSVTTWKETEPRPGEAR